MVQQTYTINFKANPVQKAFIESRAKADLYSSRMGEGKSTALCWSAFLHTRHNPGAKWVFIRDTWENIQATTLKTFFEWFPPGIMGNWHETKRTFTWASGIAQGEATFLGMDSPDDASKLMSRDFGGMAVDEPAPAVGSVGIDEMIFDIGMSRLRQKDMHWYAAKLAENNPDEAHWTYRRFVQPGQDSFRVWQPQRAENEANLPASYYAELRKLWQHRPDLIRRFVDGEFGFQAQGKAVTPQWSDKLHLATGLVAIPRQELQLLWDFGHNPTCIISQKTPLGSWNILEAIVGEGIGVEELIMDAVKPLLVMKFRNHPLRHIGDPQGKQREQTSIHRSAVGIIKKELRGPWIPGPVKTHERVEPLRAVLSRTISGRGLVQVDRENAAAVWHALRGGWHYNVARTGVIATEPKKDSHSHPGDAMGYGAAVLFPLGKIGTNRGPLLDTPRGTDYFNYDKFNIGPGPGRIPPAHGSKLILPGQ